MVKNFPKLTKDINPQCKKFAKSREGLISKKHPQMYYNKTTETKTREDHSCSHRGSEYSLTLKKATVY